METTVTFFCETHGFGNHQQIVWVTATDQNGEPTMWDVEIVCDKCEKLVTR
jgi:hypothetical protein